MARSWWVLAIVGILVTCQGAPIDDSFDVEESLQSNDQSSSGRANPFAGAVMFVNPEYTRAGDGAAAMASGSTDAQLLAAARSFPTGIWLDRIAALDNITVHLDGAREQSAQAGKPAVVLFVVYDLPDRDCAALASNGELHGAAGLSTYKSQYIDGIYQALTSKQEYSQLRIAMVVEPDSLPNLITNTNLPACAAVANQNLYLDGVRYAIDKLGSLPNVALYLDIAHSGWLGWPDNMSKAVALYTSLLGSVQHKEAVRGFATDVANYTPLREPFISTTDQSVISGSFYEWNPEVDELTYIRTLASKFSAAGLNDIGFITDTSRNGWPTASKSGHIDGRKARGNWCNVRGAGLGERPQANPSADSLLDAFVWVKPPGESDGQSSPSTSGNTPDSEGKRFDPNCDPNNSALDAMPGAPPAGHWFNDQFLMLARNAQPPLQKSAGPAPQATAAAAPQEELEY